MGNLFASSRLDLITVITSQIEDNDTGDFRAYSVIDNYVIPAVLQIDPVRKIPPLMSKTTAMSPENIVGQKQNFR